MNPSRVITRDFINCLPLAWPLMTRANPPETAMRVLRLPNYISVVLSNIADTRNPAYRDLKRLESHKWKPIEHHYQILDVIQTIKDDTQKERDNLENLIHLKSHIAKKHLQFTGLDVCGLMVSAFASNIPTMFEMSDPSRTEEVSLNPLVDQPTGLLECSSLR